MNTIITFTKAEARAIKNLKLDRFFSETVGAFVFDVNEVLDAGRLGMGFCTKIRRALMVLNNTRRVWKLETVDEDCNVYILYKTNR